MGSAVEKGRTYDVVIMGEGKRGDGLARVNGMAVFVRGAKFGDKCRIKILGIESTYAIAEIAGEP